ncbi:MAG TPA: hypothetical protein V6C76_17800 [Drouetiella sp.]
MKRTSILVAAMAMLIGFQTLQPAEARYTIYQRQVALQRDIQKGVHANELTKDEYESLKDSMADISKRIEKMKSKNFGKLSIKDQGKIERSLNDVSVKIQKLRLAKRVAK